MMKKPREHLEIIPAQSGWYVLPLGINATWVPIVGWRLSFDPENADCDHPITLPVVSGGWSVDDEYVIKSPEGNIGYVFNFDITWMEGGTTEQDRIDACKGALQNAAWGAQFEESERRQHEQQDKKEKTLQ
jgi:hypothetical protein